MQVYSNAKLDQVKKLIFDQYGDYVVFESQYEGVTPLDGMQNATGSGKITYAQGCERWSNDQSGFAEAIEIAKAADVAVVLVGTWVGCCGFLETCSALITPF